MHLNQVIKKNHVLIYVYSMAFNFILCFHASCCPYMMKHCYYNIFLFYLCDKLMKQNMLCNTINIKFNMYIVRFVIRRGINRRCNSHVLLPSNVSKQSLNAECFCYYSCKVIFFASCTFCCSVCFMGKREEKKDKIIFFCNLVTSDIHSV